ncbi:MAG: hypothetical protein R3E89_14385 [Thiolinea sp.]
MLGSLALSPLLAATPMTAAILIRSADCQTLSRDEHGGIVQRRPSFNGVGVKVLEGDLRQSITLVLDGRDRPLDFWTWVTPGFSSSRTGGMAHAKRHPEQIAGMIVRLTAAENPDPERTASYLVVSKLTADEVCVVGKVPPQVRENQNVKARPGGTGCRDALPESGISAKTQAPSQYRELSPLMQTHQKPRTACASWK